MITREEAYKRLEAVRLEDGYERLERRIKKLPRNLTKLGQDFIGKRTDYGAFYHYGNNDALERYHDSLTAIDALNVKQRRQLFSAFCPHFPEVIEQVWQDMQTAPYQESYARKSFRAPKHPALSLNKRGAWLLNVLRTSHLYDQPLEWFAVWAPHLGYGSDHTWGTLFAAAINLGRDDIYEILRSSAQGEHEIGMMGRHVTQAFLKANKPEGWQYMSKMLLAAQRQEGLRQTILEAIDLAHPEGFKLMLATVLEHNLLRFAATQRAVDIWFGLRLVTGDRAGVKALERVATMLHDFLSDETARATALVSGDPEAVYIALWSYAFEDVDTALEHAKTLLHDDAYELRFVSLLLLQSLNIAPVDHLLLPLLDDDDLHIALKAQQAMSARLNSKHFDQVEALFERMPENVKLPAVVWDWTAESFSKDNVFSSLMPLLGERPIARLLKHVDVMGGAARYNFALFLERRFNERKVQDKNATLDEGSRAALLEFAQGKDLEVCSIALRVLARLESRPSEVIELESTLTRQASSLRKGVLGIITKQTDADALASAERLTGSSKMAQRLAGLEVLRRLKDDNRAVAKVETLAQTYSERSKLNAKEQNFVEVLLAKEEEIPVLEDGFGLYDPAQKSAWRQPVSQLAKNKRDKNGHVFVSDKTPKLLQALDELVHEQRETPVRIIGYHGEHEDLLGNVRWGFWEPFVRINNEHQPNSHDIPLREVWETWWLGRQKLLRDDDGLELLRMQASIYGFDRYARNRRRTETIPKTWLDDVSAQLIYPIDALELRYPEHIRSILQWFHHRLEPLDKRRHDFIVDAAETTLALIANALAKQPKNIEATAGYYRRNWRHHTSLYYWWQQLLGLQQRYPEFWQADDYARYWGLSRWLDEGWKALHAQFSEHRERRRIGIPVTSRYWQHGLASEADVFDALLPPENAYNQSDQRYRYYGSAGFPDLHQLTRRKLNKQFQRLVESIPELVAVVERCRERVLGIELARGDLPTPASQVALSLSSVYGTNKVIRMLESLGRLGFVRGYTIDGLSKQAVFSHLIRISFPNEDDTPESFAKQVKQAKLSDDKLLELAMYAPQWTPYVAHTLGWKDLDDAVYWFHAHTRGHDWRVSNDIRETWVAEVAERTPLSAQNLVDGAVDVAWFERVYKSLGKQKWAQLYKAAKYASSTGGYKRAQLFADALLGQRDEKDLLSHVDSKRNQESLRALGLLPLSRSEKKRQSQLLARYQFVQEFLRASKKFGAQRRASERLAADIALENLARTASYSDPQRLSWAMEAEAVKDLAQGAIEVRDGETVVALSVTAEGKPLLSVEKKGKPLKNIPAKLKKHPEIVTLRERKSDLDKQVSRMRGSLEEAMCLGELFAASDLQGLMKHPVMKPMLESLVLTTENGALGYPVAGQLQRVDGAVVSLGDTNLRIAHSHDLLESGLWHEFQKECFEREQKQPFKQIFRELYVPTKAEREAVKYSRRYEGHQVNPRQAMALLGQRNWINVPDEGVRRTFHREGISAHLEFLEGFYTPAEVDGLTIETVRFSKRGSWEWLEFDTIPPRLFSEVMRDLDLVVSVAHQGGVDPEASASTVEMRTSLLRETLSLLKIDNVRLQNSHALIQGGLGEYSVHLGSANVHRLPGGALCIIPVHSQQRGRLFLPFADDDPKTAEVVSKVLLLAEDKTIQDPTILEQLR